MVMLFLKTSPDLSRGTDKACPFSRAPWVQGVLPQSFKSTVYKAKEYTLISTKLGNFSQELMNDRKGWYARCLSRYCWHYYRCSPLLSPLSTSMKPVLPHPRPTSHCCLCPWATNICSLANLFAVLYPYPLPPFSLWQLSVCSMYPCLWFCFVHSLFCSLDFTYKWDHTVFVFLWLAYFM